MISQQIAISYQFLISDALNSLDYLKSESFTSQPENTLSSCSSIHQMIPVLDAELVPPALKNLFLRLRQFIGLEKKEECLPEISQYLAVLLQKTLLLSKSGEIYSPPFVRLIIDMLFYLLNHLSSLSENETVLYYVLRHAERIDSHLGPQTTKRFLFKPFPGGIDALGQFVHKQYQERGFERLHPMIEKHLRALAHD